MNHNASFGNECTVIIDVHCITLYGRLLRLRGSPTTYLLHGYYYVKTNDIGKLGPTFLPCLVKGVRKEDVPPVL
jgi:hypothetical protein